MQVCCKHFHVHISIPTRTNSRNLAAIRKPCELCFQLFAIIIKMCTYHLSGIHLYGISCYSIGIHPLITVVQDCQLPDMPGANFSVSDRLGICISIPYWSNWFMWIVNHGSSLLLISWDVYRKGFVWVGVSYIGY